MASIKTCTAGSIGRAVLQSIDLLCALCINYWQVLAPFVSNAAVGHRLNGCVARMLWANSTGLSSVVDLKELSSEKFSGPVPLNATLISHLLFASLLFCFVSFRFVSFSLVSFRFFDGNLLDESDELGRSSAATGPPQVNYSTPRRIVHHFEATPVTVFALNVKAIQIRLINENECNLTLIVIVSKLIGLFFPSLFYLGFFLNRAGLISIFQVID